MKNATAYALNTGRQLAKIGCGVVHLKSNWTNVARDARRAARRGWHTAEDIVDEVAIAVKRQPLESLCITFGVALGIGALLGWLGTRK